MEMRLNKKYEKVFVGVVLALALVFYLIFIQRTSFHVGEETYFTLIEDAMISMRYAKHLANGYGLVWNVGEPPVQGFTNFGWTLFMALVHLFPVAESKISLVMMISASMILLGNALLAYKLTRIISPDQVISPKIVLIITAFYYPLVFWSLRGMEVGLATFLVLSVVTVMLQKDESIGIKRSILIGSLAILAISVRIDVLLQIGVIMLYILYKYVVKEYSNFWKTTPSWLLLLAGFAGILLFQFFYFDSILPNTYYLKVDGISYITRINSGLQTLVEYSSRDFNMLLFFVMGGLLIFKDLRNSKAALFLALFFVQCIYSIYVGGDYSEPLWSNGVDSANRFISQGMPYLILLFGITLERFINSLHLPLLKDAKMGYNFKASFNIAVFAGTAALVIMSGEPWFKWAIYNSPGLGADSRYTKLAIHIRENTEENAVIAVIAAGQVPYYSDRVSIDLLGKNDPFIAKGPPVPGERFLPGHNKYNLDYSITQFTPDVIAFAGSLGDYFDDDSSYSMLENKILVRDDSELIDIEGLDQNFED